GGAATGMFAIQALCFLIITGIQTALALAQQQPARWGELADHPWTVLADPTFLPRFLHFVFAALSLAGALLAWWAVRPARGRGSAASGAAASVSSEPAAADPGGALRTQAKLGVRVALLFTGLQIVDGFWLLLSLPQGVMLGLMRSGASSMIPFGLGVV